MSRSFLLFSLSKTRKVCVSVCGACVPTRPSAYLRSSQLPVFRRVTYFSLSFSLFLPKRRTHPSTSEMILN